MKNSLLGYENSKEVLKNFKERLEEEEDKHEELHSEKEPEEGAFS